MAEKEEGKRTYILNMRDGTKQKITVPKNWKLTFGPLVPGSKDGNVNSRDALVLRIYEGNKDNQRAVFTDVASWRDTNDLQIEVEKVDTQQKGVRVNVEGEGEKIIQANMEVRQWVNPDEPRKADIRFGSLDAGMPLLKNAESNDR